MNNLKRKTKKAISSILILILLLVRVSPFVVLAQEQEVDNTTSVENNVDSTADTGENTLSEEEPTASPEASSSPTPEASPEASPSPSPSPEASPLDSPSPSPTSTSSEETVDNTADVVTNVDSTAETGENTVEEPSPSPSALPDTGEVTETGDEGLTDPGEPEEEVNLEIETGDALSVAEVENSLNTTEVDSQVYFHTLNIFLPQGQDIDLASVPYAIAQTVFDGEVEEAVINVAVLGVDNFAYLSNDVISFANTGANSIEGGEEAVILTGDAYSIASLLNKVNTTIVGSTLHLVVINIFGNVETNILLPEFGTEGGCCFEVVKIENKASVENNVNSLAVTGENLVVGEEGASITTGDAESVVNVVNVVNKSLISVIFHYLTINTFGTWIGDFLGWDDILGLEGGQSLDISSTASGNANGDCPTCIGGVDIQNEAQVVNNVSSTANTGGNSIYSGSGSIVTGRAYSVVSIFNLINSTIVNSTGFFGFINIFGSLVGDIGGASFFAVETTEPEDTGEDLSETEASDESVRLSGGELDIYQKNNVGTHVLPGDTVTFFVDIRNPGTGPVYDTILRIGLINKNGVDMGGANYNLGEIQPGKGVRVTTGITLSENAEPGDYIAHAVVSGYVGPDDILISKYSDSFLTIVGISLPVVAGQTQASGPDNEVLGVNSAPAGLTREQKMIIYFLGLLGTYLPAKGYQKRKELAVVISRSGKYLGSKALAFRSFLTGLLA